MSFVGAVVKELKIVKANYQQASRPPNDQETAIFEKLLSSLESIFEDQVTQNDALLMFQNILS